MIQNVAELTRVGRDADVSILHCIAVRRRDGRGANTNARLFQYMAKAQHPLHPGSDAAALLPGIGARDDELVLALQADGQDNVE